MPLDLSTVVTLNDEHVEAAVDDEILMMSIERGYYYGLKDTGKRIWDLLREPRTVTSVIETLTAEDEIDRPTCTREVLSFLNDLKADNLIRIADEPAP